MPTRTKHVVVRYAPDELSRVRARARVSHTPIARYIREASLGHTPRPKELSAYADLLQTLNRVGLDLEALLTAGPHGDRETDVGAALAELRGALRVIADQARPGRPRAVATAAQLE